MDGPQDTGRFFMRLQIEAEVFIFHEIIENLRKRLDDELKAKLGFQTSERASRSWLFSL